MTTMLQSSRTRGPVSKRTHWWNGHGSGATAGFLTSDTTLYGEDFFRRILVLERKRTERSKKTFMLMLVDITGLHQQKVSQRIIGSLIRFLHSVSRETDIKGWYSTGRIVGVIFLDLDGAGADTIIDKVNLGLGSLLTAAQTSMISISHFIFPEPSGDGGNGSALLNTLLYGGRREKKVAGGCSLFCKRIIDIAGSIIGIMLFSPVFLMVPFLIKCTSRGPVLFRQERVGQYGKKFTLIKFRSMKACSDHAIHREFVQRFINNSSGSSPAGESSVFKMKEDPRITTVGRFLRKTSLDEIPQFFNVLFGDMSLVGPRPAIPYEVDEYDLWHKRRVLEAKPGITGVWQVKGRSRTDFTSMVRMDIRYIKSWSPLTDLHLIIRTPLALVSAKGAY